MKYLFTNDKPIYLQLIEQLEFQIVSGRIPPGERLPSVRDFAAKTKVNPNTIQRALTTLEEHRLIYTESTNGRYITTDEKLIKKLRERFAEEKSRDFFHSMADLGFTKPEAIEFIKQKGNLHGSKPTK